MFGPVGGAANPGVSCLTGSGRCLWQSARSGSLLQPWSAVPSTVRFSGSACRGPGLAMALRRVLVVAAVFRRRPRAGFTGCPGLSRAVGRGLGLAGCARSVSGRSSSLQNLRDRHSLVGPDCLGVFERAWQSLRFSSTATRPLSCLARGQGLQFRPRTRRHGPTGRVFPGHRGGLARLGQPGLASADRLLADLLLAGGFRDGGFSLTARPTRSGPRDPRAEPWPGNSRPPASNTIQRSRRPNARGRPITSSCPRTLTTTSQPTRQKASHKTGRAN